MNKTKTKIYNAIKDCLSHWLDGKTLKTDSDLIFELGLDSVAILELILELENQFDLKISNDEISIETFNNLSNLITLIEEKCK